MAATSWPRVNEDTTDAQYGELFNSIIGSGVRDGLTVSADSSGLTVKVAPGFAVVSGNAFLSSAVESLAIAANSTGAARTDLIYLRRDFTAPAGQTVRLLVKTGSTTLAADPRAGYDLPLAYVTVPANAATIAPANVTDRRPGLSSPVGLWATDARPALTDRRFGFNTTTGRWEYSTGTTWRDLIDWATIPGKPGAFTPTPHQHATGDLIGTLPVSQGGTGATSAAAALQALGIFVQATDPGQANGRVWIKRP